MLSPLLLLVAACTHIQELGAQEVGQKSDYNDPRLMLGGLRPAEKPMEYKSEESTILNCFSRLEDKNGFVASQMTVNILPKSPGSYGNQAAKSRPGGGLTARIQIASNLKNASKAYVFLTDRARVSGGCSNDGLGKIRLSDKERFENPWQFKSTGYAGYIPPSYGWGRGYNTNYGYGSYNTGYAHGLGLGYGAYNGGLGFGLGGLGMYFGAGPGGQENGHMLGRTDWDKGAITVFNLTPGGLTSSFVDNVGFNDLRDLAGRGIAVCSDITYDSEWNPICLEPIYSCCSLKYDNVELSLVGP